MLIVRYGELPQPERWLLHVRPFAWVFVVFLISFAAVGLYQLDTARNNRAFLKALMQAVISATAVAAIFFYVVRPGITPRLNLILFVVIVSIIITLWRRLVNAFLGAALLRRTIILGYSRDALELAGTLIRNPQLGYAFVCLALSPSETSHHTSAADEHVPARVMDKDALLSFIDAERIDLFIPATPAHASPTLVQQLYAREQSRVSVADLLQVFEAATGKVAVQSINELWFLEHSSTLAKPWYEFVKRVIDIILALISSIPALVITPFMYLAIKLDTPGSGFFVQRRVGKNGKEFLAVKFRSMYVNSETRGPAWAIPNDPRVTRTGKFLRKTRLDELPQLWNILKGDMSFVGPRPEQPALVDQLSQSIPFYRERLHVKPGLTGWDQISGIYHNASREDTLEKLQYDLYYIKNRSFLLDATILLRTIKTVLSAQGR